MNTKRIYTGDLYVNLKSMDSNDGSLTETEEHLIEKNILLVKVGNRFIDASVIKNKFDLLSFYTFLKNRLNEHQYIYSIDSKIEGEKYIDSKSLKKYSKVDEDIEFDRFLKICTAHEYTREPKKMKKFIDSFDNVI